MQYSDYAVRVLLGEVIVKLVMVIKNCSYQTADEFIHAAWYLSRACNSFIQKLLSSSMGSTFP